MDVAIPAILFLCCLGMLLIFVYLPWVWGIPWAFSDMYSRIEKLEKLRQQTGKRYLFLRFFGSTKRVIQTLDDVSPRSLEIAEHKATLKLLGGVKGLKAEEGRRQLEQAIEELYATPQREAEIDGDAYVDYLQPQLEVIHAMRKSTDGVFFGSRIEKLKELNS